MSLSVCLILLPRGLAVWRIICSYCKFMLHTEFAHLAMEGLLKIQPQIGSVGDSVPPMVLLHTQLACAGEEGCKKCWKV